MNFDYQSINICLVTMYNSLEHANAINFPKWFYSTQGFRHRKWKWMGLCRVCCAVLTVWLETRLKCSYHGNFRNQIDISSSSGQASALWIIRNTTIYRKYFSVRTQQRSKINCCTRFFIVAVILVLFIYAWAFKIHRESGELPHSSSCEHVTLRCHFK